MNIKYSYGSPILIWDDVQERTIATIKPSQPTQFTKENVPTSIAANGEEIIHLPATPIDDSPLTMLVLGGITLVAILLLSREN